MAAGIEVARIQVLATADASKKDRHHASEELWRLPDTVTGVDAWVSLDAPVPSKPRLAKTEERQRVA